jgi:hypothetical protein
MLQRNMMQEIQDMKANGFSLGEVIRHYADGSGKGPSEPTIRKYYNMEVIPEDIKAGYRRDMAFSQEPFNGAIIEILTNNPKCYASSIYDVLEDRFIDNGQYDALPGNAQTLRNYIRYLKQSGAVELDEAKHRTHDLLDPTPAGQQMLIDFGQQNCGGGLTVHFICLLLRMSRMLTVFAQDHRFNGEEACRAIYRCFCKLGGRPKELVIDQDAVFIASETYGEVIETQIFKTFLDEQDLRLWVCNKADPESKGPIENSVKFVKSNYFSARTITSIDEVVSTLPGWLERKNKRIHQATFLVPAEVFDTVEKPALTPLVPSVYESAPMNLISADVHSKPFINYRSSKYSVPWECCFSRVYYKAIGDKLHIYGSDRRHLCTHDINPIKGERNRLPEHKREPSMEWMVTAERMRSKYNCFDFQHFVNGFKKENGERHLAKQLGAVERYLDDKKPDVSLVAEVMAICCRDFRYKFSQFKAVYDLAEAKRATPTAIQMSDVQKRSLESYQIAFDQRCAG